MDKWLDTCLCQGNIQSFSPSMSDRLSSAGIDGLIDYYKKEVYLSSAFDSLIRVVITKIETEGSCEYLGHIERTEDIFCTVMLFSSKKQAEVALIAMKEKHSKEGILPNPHFSYLVVEHLLIVLDTPKLFTYSPDGKPLPDDPFGPLPPPVDYSGVDTVLNNMVQAIECVYSRSK